MRKVNPKVSMNSKYKVGMRVVGQRSPNAFRGVLVEVYATVNTNRCGTFRNPAYVIKCDVDGKHRSFQAIKQENDFNSRFYNIK